MGHHSVIETYFCLSLNRRASQRRRNRSVPTLSLKLDSRAHVLTDAVVMEHVIFWHSQLSSLATRQLKELNEHTTDWKGENVIKSRVYTTGAYGLDWFMTVWRKVSNFFLGGGKMRKRRDLICFLFLPPSWSWWGRCTRSHNRVQKENVISVTHSLMEHPESKAAEIVHCATLH